LGGELIAEVERVLDSIADDPLRYPIVFKDIREAIVARFPFAVYYRVKPGRVIIIAVFHCSRDPGIWQARP
jgi:plasmid stabilization system protein ParE